MIYVRERIDSGHESIIEVVAATLEGAQAGHDGWEQVVGYAQQAGSRHGWGTHDADDWLLITEHELESVLEARVALGCTYVDSIYVEHAWRTEAIATAVGRRCHLWEVVSEIAQQAGAAGDHEWCLAHGLTIDYSSLGYPEGDGGPSRRARERLAYAELEAAWWRAVVRPRGV